MLRGPGAGWIECSGLSFRLAAHRGEPELGIEQCENGEAMFAERYGIDHVHRIPTLAILAAVQREYGSNEQARKTHELAIEIAETAGIDAHPTLATHLEGLAYLVDPDEARTLRDRAHKMLNACVGPSSPRVLDLSGIA